MAILANLSIDVSKIDKSKLIVGKKGTYLNVTISVNDDKDDYQNDISAWQSQTKEEREAKQPKVYLGNGRKIWEGESQVQNNQSNSSATNPDEDFNDLPF